MAEVEEADPPAEADQADEADEGAYRADEPAEAELEGDEDRAEAEAYGEAAGESDDVALEGGTQEPKREAWARMPAEPDEAEPDEAEAEPMLELGHDGKYTVRMRQQLRTAARAEQFCCQLLEKVEEEKSSGKTVVFEDFDISQNVIPSEQLEGIFAALADGGVHVQRFRAFGCPTLNDQAATFLAGWLAGVTRETVPYELHLSDCAITSDGFRDLAKALEENEAFPGPDPKSPSRTLPLYIRLEHNYIEESAIQAAIDEGVLMTMRKNEGVRHTSSAKGRLLVREDGAFQQKRGEPPAPEDAPPPKRVHDKGKGDKGKGGKGKSKGKDHEQRLRDARDRGREFRERNRERPQDRERERGRGLAGRGYDAKQRPPPWAALPSPRPTQSSRPDPSRPVFGKGDRRRLEAERPAPPRRYEAPAKGAPAKGAASPPRGSTRSGPYNAFSRGGNQDLSRGKGGSTSDRFADRRDVIGSSARPSLRRQAELPREEEAAKRPRAATPGSKGSGLRAGGDYEAARVSGSSRPRTGSGLPAGWEEHWSSEYQLAYYWHTKTGEAAWERPRG